ncbi:Glucokinase-1 [Candida viswanathii]|uniref:Phosphotransferase n=1 Tax=Candida viswanathii TaxID=5486 RepID=A0A367YKB7_9ASCO|nr:Glucokinase-1 [Candida viswanathii]
MSLPDKLESALQAIEKDFHVDDEFLVKATDYFIEQLDVGLKAPEQTRETIPMIPTYVTNLPTGKEKGLYLAADLGGTNFRVCSIDLHGDHTYELQQEKFRIPDTLMKGVNSSELFSYLAKRVQGFLLDYHPDTCSKKNAEPIKLGFTFSFPVNQTEINHGTLIRWTKGFDIPDTVDRDVVDLLQANLTILEVNVKVVALVNDTTASMIARAYLNDKEKSNATTVVGCIFGTGTNGAYYETIDKITKLSNPPADAKGMLINTEWGSFDNALKILPCTKFDDAVDAETPNPGYHLFEKRISGRFLGEILRVALIDLFKQGLIFQDLYKERGGSLPHRIDQPWLLDSEVLSYLQIDDSTDLKMSSLILANVMRLKTTKEERQVIQRLTRAILSRSAKLAAIALAGVAKRVKDQHKDEDYDLEIAADGSVVEFYPGFREKVSEVIDLINPLEGSKKKVIITISKLGSALGAALAAATA